MLHRYIVFSLTSHSLMETQFVSILAAVDNVSMNTHEHTHSVVLTYHFLLGLCLEELLLMCQPLGARDYRQEPLLCWTDCTSHLLCAGTSFPLHPCQRFSLLLLR